MLGTPCSKQASLAKWLSVCYELSGCSHEFTYPTEMLASQTLEKLEDNLIIWTKDFLFCGGSI